MMTGEIALQRLREAGLRLTPQRRAVIDALEGNRSHPDVDAVAARVTKQIPGVSLSTVYKTLHELADLDIVQRLDLPGSMRFDPDTTDHAHAVCDSCGTVFDVALDESVLSSVAERAAQSGVRVGRVQVSLFGTCEACTAA